MSAEPADEPVDPPSSCREFTPRTRAANNAAKAAMPRRGSCCRCFLDCWRSLIIIPELTEREKSRGKVHWVEVLDLCVALVLIILCYWTPFEVALLPKRPAWCVLMNRVIDIFFTFDLLLQFFIACPSGSKDLSAEPWCQDPCVIIKRYCGLPLSENGQAGWFWIDGLSITPGWVEFAEKWCRTGTNYGHQCRALLLFRVVRLVLRMPRVARFIDRLQAVRGFPYANVDFTKTLFVTTMACHWFACAWMLCGTMPDGRSPDEEPQKTWLTVLVDSKGDPCIPDYKSAPLCAYFLAAYWSAMTLTTVGYGDITPQSEREYMLCTVLMLVSGYVWAFLVGEVVSLLSNLNPHVTRFKRRIDDLTDLMSDRSLPRDLQVRLRRYVHEAKTVEWEKDQDTLLGNTLSPGLQREVVQCSATDHLLRGIDWVDSSWGDDARLELAKSFQALFFGPQEAIMLGQVILVIRRGILAVNGRILRRGDCWGHHNILLESPQLQDRNQPRTLSYVSVMVLYKQDLFAVARLFPAVERRIRLAQIKTATCRAIIMAARAQMAWGAKGVPGVDSDAPNSARSGGLARSAMLVMGQTATRAMSSDCLEARVEAYFEHVSSQLAKLTSMCEALTVRAAADQRGAK